MNGQPIHWTSRLGAGCSAAASRVRRLTADGHELTFAINHLGHFAFTGLPLERLAAKSRARVLGHQAMRKGLDGQSNLPRSAR